MYLIFLCRLGFIQEVRKISTLPLSAHLMVTEPAYWVEQLIAINCEWICMHAEVLDGLAFRLIDQIHNAGLKAGIVLNPETPVSVILPYIDLLDKVTIMTVDQVLLVSASSKGPSIKLWNYVTCANNLITVM